MGIENDIVAMIPDLKKRALVLTKNPQWVDDLVQDTITRALDKKSLFKEGTNLDAWMFVMMRNIFNTFLYKKLGYKHDKPIISVDRIHPSAKSHTPEMGKEDFTVLHEHIACLKQYNNDYFSVLMYRYSDNLTTKEISTKLNISIGTVMSRVERGKKFIKNLIVLKQLDDPNAKTMDGQRFHNWFGIYFHGKAEDLVYSILANAGAPDLISGSISLDDVKDGMHTCSVYGQLATALIWTHSNKNMRRGLVVLNEDLKSIEYAKNLYREKPDAL